MASARIAGLERMLGARLLHRTTRRVSLTQEGEIFAAHARGLLDAAEAARASVGRAREHPHGRLRVTMPSSLGRQHISPLIPAFLREYPGVPVDLRMTDQIVDLVDEGIDLAIRIGALKDSTLVAKSSRATGACCARRPRIWPSTARRATPPISRSTNA